MRLEGDVDIGAAVDVKALLLEALASRRGLRVELGGTTALDVTAYQLLWAAQRAADKAGMKFSVEGPMTEGIALAMAHAGLEQFPGNPR